MVFVQETEGRTLFSVNKIQTFQILQFLTNLKHFGAKIQSNPISFVPYARPQFQSYGVETLHAASRPCETSELIARGLTNSRRLQLEERKSSVILAKAKLEILALLCPMGSTLG